MKSFRFTLAMLAVLGWTSSAQAVPFVFNAVIDSFVDPSTSFSDLSTNPPAPAPPIDFSDQQVVGSAFGGLRQSRTQVDADAGPLRAHNFSVGGVGGELLVETLTFSPTTTTTTTLIYDGIPDLLPPPLFNTDPLASALSLDLLSFNPADDGLGLTISQLTVPPGGIDFILTLNTRNDGTGALEQSTVTNNTTVSTTNLIFFDFNDFITNNLNTNLSDVFGVQLQIVADGSLTVQSRGLGLVAIAAPGSVLVLGIGLVGLVGFIRYRRVPVT